MGPESAVSRCPRRPLGWLLLPLLAACPGPGGTGPNPVATSLVLSLTSLNFDAIGATQQVTATVRDQNGQAMNVTVTWSASGAALSIVPAGNTVTVTGVGPGPGLVVASHGSLQATLNVQVAQVPVAPVKVSGDLQTGAAGVLLSVPLRVLIQDRLGVPIAGSPVSFAVTQGGGSIVPGTANTAPDGIASAQWTLGPVAGSAQEVRVQAGSAAATFGAQAQPGPAASLEATAGQGQTGPAGSAVPVPPAVQVRDALGNPVGGVPVSFAVGLGGGIVTGANGTSGTNGVVAVGSWQLGQLAGPNTLIASAPGVPALTFNATGQPGPAATLAVHQGQGQGAPAGSPVPVSPAVVVRDQFGNPVSGAAVAFGVTGGGGSITGAAATSNDAGIAAVGSWTLGPAPGLNTLSASVAGITPLQFTAVATAVPASIAINGGDNQSAPTGAPVPVQPSVIVRDALNNPLAGIPVNFAVTGGGGSIAGAAATTNSSGVATLESWTLGPAPGPNTLSASTGSLPPVTFNATGIGVGPPASVALVAGNNQAAVPGTGVPVAPAVRVRDVLNQPVPGATVTFAITRGAGSLVGSVATTDAAGIATLGNWNLGPGVNCMTATVSGSGVSGNPVSFVASGIAAPGPGYQVHVQFLSCMTPTQEAAFANAAARWSQVITGDVADLLIGNIGAGACGSNSPAIVNRTIDDLVIFATIEPIDGVGGILGSAGPCFIRTGSNFPVIGRMRFDVADVGNLEAQGRFTDVILHEMGHVIGIGTLWNTFGLLQLPSPVGGPSQDTHHNGANAITGFNAIGGSTYTGGAKVPVENMFGGGTINAHWRESVLVNELMTGFLNGGTANPLSELTVRSLADFGYQVDPAAADQFFLVLSLRAEGPPEVLIRLENDVIMGPLYTIDSQGRIRRVR